MNIQVFIQYYILNHGEHGGHGVKLKIKVFVTSEASHITQ